MDNLTILNEIQRLYFNNLYKEALELIESNSRKSVPNHPLSAWKAACVLRLGDQQKASEIIAGILELDPKQKDAIRVRGSSHKLRMIWTQPFAIIQKPFASIPDSPWHSIHAPQPIGKKRNWMQPFAIIPKPSASNQIFPGHLIIAAAIYSKKNDQDAAIRDYSEAIRLDPKFAWLSILEQLCIIKKDNWIPPCKIATKPSALTQISAGHLIYRGLIYADKGDPDSAFRDYSEAIRLDPKNAAAFSNRGNAFLNKGDLDAAFRDLTRPSN